jgi:hypothetical protein
MRVLTVVTTFCITAAVIGAPFSAWSADVATARREHANRAVAPADWVGDLTPIPPAEWNAQRAAHLLQRAGFGGTPAEVAQLAAMTPTAAVNHLVDFESIDVSHLPEFEESNIYPNGYKFAGLQEVAPAALLTGKAFGIPARQEGKLPLQPGINEFYTLLWSDYAEMRRAGQWWAERMLITPRPFQERMTLYWHDHFATSQDKLHRHRKMLAHIDMFRQHGLTNFRDLLIKVSHDPAMLVWLDNKDNVKGKPNENYAREIMELFCMGEGQGYTETDIRELARCFTGWTTTKDVTTKPGQGDFVNKPELHDDGEKTFLGETGNFDGYQAIDIILKQDATAKFLSGKIYRYFVNEQLSDELNARLAKQLQDSDYDLKSFMKTLLLSKDFYSEPNVGTQIKEPVVLVVSTYRKLGLDAIPGVPDFNTVCGDLGQVLFFPPNVAGWAGDRTWINPATLLTRGNFVEQLLFPADPNTTEPDDKRVHPGYAKIPLDFTDYDIVPKIWSNETQRMEPVTLAIYDLYMAGMSSEEAIAMMKAGEGMSDSEMKAKLAMNKMESKSKMSEVSQGEQYNLAVGVYTGAVQANDRIKPIPRTVAQVNFVEMAKQADLKTVDQTVNYFCNRFLSVPLSQKRYQAIADFLTAVNGSDSLNYNDEQLDQHLRRLIHLILSAPEYQLS